MTGSKAAFFEIDNNVIDWVEFGDYSWVEISRRATVVFWCLNDEH
jgi:hypothetical protein